MENGKRRISLVVGTALGATVAAFVAGFATGQHFTREADAAVRRQDSEAEFVVQKVLAMPDTGAKLALLEELEAFKDSGGTTPFPRLVVQP